MSRPLSDAGGLEPLADEWLVVIDPQAIFADPAGNPLDLHHRYAPPKPGGDQGGGK